MQVLFVQGGGDGVHDEWDNKLVDSLRRGLGPGYDIRYPRMPQEGDPHYQPWKAAIVDQLATLDDGAILVGHSLGAAILVAALADGAGSIRPGGVFLVAPPFVGDGGWPSDEIASMTDLGKRLPSGLPIHAYVGGDDETVPAGHADRYRDAVPGLVLRRLPGRDHQLNDDLTEVAGDILAIGAA